MRRQGQYEVRFPAAPEASRTSRLQRSRTSSPGCWQRRPATSLSTGDEPRPLSSQSTLSAFRRLGSAPRMALLAPSKRFAGE